MMTVYKIVFDLLTYTFIPITHSSFIFLTTNHHLVVLQKL